MDVFLVGLDPDMQEIRSLIASAGYGVRGEMVQRRARPDARTFVGKGKLVELRKAVGEAAVQAVVCAGTLRPGQHYELEKALGVQCFDRVRVILEIFTQRAHSREAKLQVELAMLQYEIPILKEWIHAAALGERPGFMAGGEYRVASYYETVKRRMTKIRTELESIRKERALRRDYRHERGFHAVSIAGYANAGKSSLFQALSGEPVLVDDRLFTTLSTTTRTLRGVRRRILLTDTVGFVSDVPLWLVDAFRSTFEEVFASDLVLLLLDASDPFHIFREKVDLAVATLTPGMEPDRVQPVLSKCDLAPHDVVERNAAAVHFPRTPLAISVRTGEGLSALRSLIADEFRYPVPLKIQMPQGDRTGAFLAWLHRRTEVLEVTYHDRDVRVELRCRERDVSRIEAEARASGAASLPT